MKGEYVLVETTASNGANKLQLKNYIDELQSNENNGNLNAEQLLKEFKNMPFVCISNRTTYNSAGRIKSMYFEQVIDGNYEVYK